MNPDEAVQATAATQQGHITGAQALAFGLSRDQVWRRHRGGGWVRVIGDVYRMPGTPETKAGTLVAVGLWLGDQGHFNGPTGARIYGLEGAPAPERITVARYSGATHPLVKVTRLTPEDRPRTRLVKGLRVAHVERVLAEITTDLPARNVGLALDDALRRRLTTVDRMRAFLEQWAGRPGARTLRQLVAGRDHRDEKVRTLFESAMLRILKRIKEHRFEPNHKVVASGRTYYIDFFLVSVALGIECHSYRWHNQARLAADARRDERIRALGIELLYFTWDEVMMTPREVEAGVRAAIARRQATEIHS